MTDAKYGPNSINSEDKYFSFSVSFTIIIYIYLVEYQMIHLAFSLTLYWNL